MFSPRSHDVFQMCASKRTIFVFDQHQEKRILFNSPVPSGAGSEVELKACQFHDTQVLTAYATAEKVELRILGVSKPQHRHDLDAMDVDIEIEQPKEPGKSKFRRLRKG